MDSAGSLELGSNMDHAQVIKVLQTVLAPTVRFVLITSDGEMMDYASFTSGHTETLAMLEDAIAQFTPKLEDN